MTKEKKEMVITTGILFFVVEIVGVFVWALFNGGAPDINYTAIVRECVAIGKSITAAIVIVFAAAIVIEGFRRGCARINFPSRGGNK